MPTKPRIPCKHPGCPALIPAGEKYCNKHLPLHPEAVRSAAARGYNRAWQKASKMFLAVHPLCAKCAAEGVYHRATVVDHIVPHRGDQVLFWDRNNWQALCKKHHDQKTGMKDSHPVYKY